MLNSHELEQLLTESWASAPQETQQNLEHLKVLDAHVSQIPHSLRVLSRLSVPSLMLHDCSNIIRSTRESLLTIHDPSGEDEASQYTPAIADQVDYRRVRQQATFYYRSLLPGNILATGDYMYTRGCLPS